MARKQRDPTAEDLATIQRLAGEGATIEAIRAALGVGGGVWKRWARDPAVQEALEKGPLLVKAQESATRYRERGAIAAKLGLTIEQFKTRMKDPEFADAVELGRGLFDANLIDALTQQAGSKSQAALTVAKLISGWAEAPRGHTVEDGQLKPLSITGPELVTFKLSDDKDDPAVPSEARRRWNVRPADELEGELIETPKALPAAPPEIVAVLDPPEPVEPADSPKSSKFLCDRDGWPIGHRNPTVDIKEHRRQQGELADARGRWAANQVSGGRYPQPPKETELANLSEKERERALAKHSWMVSAWREIQDAMEEANQPGRAIGFFGR